MSARATVKVMLVAATVVGALYFVYLVRQIVALVFIAIFVAVALGPLVDLYQRGPVKRWMAILGAYLTVMLGVFGIGLLVVPPVVDEVNAFVDDVPGYVDDLRKSETLREYDDKYAITEKLREQAEKLPERLGDVTGALQSVTVGVFSALVQLVTVLVLAFFLLLDGRRLIGWIVRELGPERGRRAEVIAGEVYRAIGGYVVGNLAISLIAGTTTYIVLTVLGVPFAVPLAVLMAFLDLIPLVGATIAGVIIGIVAGIDDFPTALIVWGVFFIVYQQVENNVLQPVIYRRTVALHPLVVLIAVLVGGTLLGVLGALLAIPAAAAIQILVRNWWQIRKGEEPGARPRPKEPPGPPTELEPEPA
ncbi:MAG TPA: AI-2E family transporter [Thermoleophilaceae bacterium]|nr:AI-2E family transporter [Thermoleophilaceae bacterium]